jgi:hypothetical protein
MITMSLKDSSFQLTVFGEGEVALSIPFGPDQKDEFDFDFKNVGSVTKVLYDMKVGDKVGLRGPYGKAYPTDELKGPRPALCRLGSCPGTASKRPGAGNGKTAGLRPDCGHDECQAV